MARRIGGTAGGAAGAAGLLLLAAAILPAGAPVGAAGPAAEGVVASTESSALPFGPGELCRFAVKFGFVRAGEATLGVEGPVHTADGTAIRFVSTARSSRFFTTFFPVEDRVESVWSPRSRLPVSFAKDIREGKYEKRVSVTFDHVAGVARYADGETAELLPEAQDVLSAFYFVRAQPLAPGTILRVPNHADGKNYPLEINVLRRETVEVPAGRFSCLVVEPLLKSAGLFKQEGSLTIWLTDDARRLPVLMRSKVAVGAITAELESWRPGRPVGAGAGVGEAGASRGGRGESR